MKKILHVGMSSEIGGIETFVMNLFRGIDRNKFQFDFITTGNIAYEKEILELGGNIFKITPRRENYLKHYFEMKYFFEENRDYDYIHQHVINSSYILPLTLSSKKIKKIVHSHRAGRERNLRIALFNILNRRKLINNSDNLLACSKEAGEYMFNTKKFTIIPNSIDTKLYAFNKNMRDIVRKDLSIDDKLVIGHVGRLTYAKNHKLLLNIFKNINENNENTVLLLVGNGELKNELIEYAEKLNISKSVKFLGARSDINELLQAMDMFIFPSHYEGLGTAVIEAQTAGLRCYISNNIPSEVNITGKCTPFSINEDPQKIATKILNDFNMKPSYDRSYLSNIVENSEYDIEKLVSIFEEMYSE